MRGVVLLLVRVVLRRVMRVATVWIGFRVGGTVECKRSRSASSPKSELSSSVKTHCGDPDSMPCLAYMGS